MGSLSLGSAFAIDYDNISFTNEEFYNAFVTATKMVQINDTHLAVIYTMSTGVEAKICLIDGTGCGSSYNMGVSSSAYIDAFYNSNVSELIVTAGATTSDLYFFRLDVSGSIPSFIGLKKIQTGGSSYVSTVQTTSTDFAIAYTDVSNTDDLSIIICKLDGSSCDSEIDINTGTSAYNKVIKNSNNKLSVVSYIVSAGNAYTWERTLTGAASAGPNLFNSGSAQYIYMIEGSDNKIKIAYRDSDTNGKIISCDLDGTNCGSEIIFNNANSLFVSMTEVENRIFLAFTDTTSTSGYLVSMNLSGGDISSPSSYSSNSTYYNSLIFTTNKQLLVSYNDQSLNKGMFAISEPFTTGAEITINEPTDNSYININPFTLNVTTDLNTNLTYSLNGASNVTLGTNINSSVTSIAGIEGSNTIIVYSNYSGEISSATSSFTIDTTNPGVNLIGNVSEDTFEVNFSEIFNVTELNPSTCVINITELENVTTPDNFLINCTDTQAFTTAGLHNAFVTATDLAGNTGTYSYNFTIIPYVYVDFNNIITSALISDYSAIIYHPDGRVIVPTINNLSQILLSPVNDRVLDLGLHTIEFTKSGFNIENFTININESSGDTNYTFNVTPVTLYVEVFDGSTLTQIDFNVTISNSTDILSFQNLNNLSKIFAEIPTGEIMLTITSEGYSQGVYYNTLTAFTSLSFNVYLVPIADSSVITFTVRDFYSNLLLEDVLIEAKRISNDSLVTVQQSKTSSNGITYLYLNQLYDYQFIFTKDGYVMASVNSIPTTTTYTVKLKPDSTAYTYIDGVNYKISPSGSLIIAPENVTFSAFISGTSISYSNVSIIADGKTTLFTDTSTEPTGTTFTFDYEFLNTTTINSVVVTINYIVDGNTKTFSKKYDVILVGNDEIQALIDVGNDTTEEILLFKFIVMLTIFAAIIIASNRNDQARDYVSAILLIPTIFFIWLGWISLLYGTVLVLVLMVLYMGGNKR